jgi:tRNA(fMet)-specific endonuclease VapC
MPVTLYVLDTDILTLLHDGNAAVANHVLSHAPAEVAISVISVEEQLTGMYTKLRRAKKPEDLARAYEELAKRVRLLGSLPILLHTIQTIARYEELRALKLNVGGMDLRIAAIALENRAKVVTRNLRDFRRVPGLDLEDWSQ